MKIYKGVRTPDGCTVTVDGAPLDLRLDLKTQASARVEWGYDGTGPRQLAIAILADHSHDDMAAFNLHQAFTESVIAELDGDQWIITSDDVQATLDQIEVVPMDLQTLLNKVRGRPS